MSGCKSVLAPYTGVRAYIAASFDSRSMADRVCCNGVDSCCVTAASIENVGNHEVGGSPDYRAWKGLIFCNIGKNQCPGSLPLPAGQWAGGLADNGRLPQKVHRDEMVPRLVA